MLRFEKPHVVLKKHNFKLRFYPGCTTEDMMDAVRLVQQRIQQHTLAPKKNKKQKTKVFSNLKWLGRDISAQQGRSIKFKDFPSAPPMEGGKRGLGVTLKQVI